MKPEHVYQPGRLLKRIFSPPDRRSRTARTAFGLELELMPDDIISNSVRRNGMFDIVTAEVLHRLLDPGESAMDVGANIGFMSAVMALRVGGGGSVLSLEPHPAVCAVLEANAFRVNSVVGADVVRARRVAASSERGVASLLIGSGWSRNTGSGRLGMKGDAGGEETTIAVECMSLDDLVGASTNPVVLKLDVEGHELEALTGAERLLGESLRDVLFEDFAPQPSAVARHLTARGFTILALGRTLFGPRFSSSDSRPPHSGERNYLATRQPQRARARLGPRGWQSLKPVVPMAGRRTASIS